VRIAVLLLPVLALGAGCGYSTGSTLDSQFQTVYVKPFENVSGEYDLQAPLTNALRRKFINDTRLEVVREEDADLVLEGVILDYQLRGVTFDADDNVTQFLTVITAGIQMYDGHTGDLIWTEPKMSGESSYYTRAAGQSSDRLRGNAEVFLPTVRSFATEEENRGASEALEQLASDVFYRTVDPW
jgi:hypothetical protein